MDHRKALQTEVGSMSDLKLRSSALHLTVEAVQTAACPANFLDLWECRAVTNSKEASGVLEEYPDDTTLNSTFGWWGCSAFPHEEVLPSLVRPW